MAEPCRGGEGCATAEPARGIAAAADGCKEWARFSNTEAPSVGQGLGSNKPRSAHRLVGDFLRAAGVCIALAFALLVGGSVVAAETKALVVGSKRFTESYVLGEILAQTLRAPARLPSTSRASAIPASSSRRSPAARSISTPSTPGRSFANCSSATAIRRSPSSTAGSRRGTRGGGAVRLQQHLCAGDDARRRDAPRHRPHLRSRSGRRPELGSACRRSSSERADGWPALRKRVRRCRSPRRAASITGSPTKRCAAGRSTSSTSTRPTPRSAGRPDGARRRPRLLPAVRRGAALMRADVAAAPLRARWSGRIDAATMIAMNGEVELDGRSFAETARKFLAGGFAPASAASGAGAPATAAAGAAREPARPGSFVERSSRPISPA